MAISPSARRTIGDAASRPRAAMIYLIRHGETAFNAERRYQGGLDSPLTARGEAQARAMGRMLRDLVDPATVALFASPRGRTVATAQIGRASCRERVFAVV